jgi:hypothetical protein
METFNIYGCDFTCLAYYLGQVTKIEKYVSNVTSLFAFVLKILGSIEGTTSFGKTLILLL